MAPNDAGCIFCSRKEWDEKEVEMLDWYSQHMNGRLDTRICTYHSERQAAMLPKTRTLVQEETKRHIDTPEQARQRVYMHHYRELQADQKPSGGCCLVM